MILDHFCKQVIEDYKKTQREKLAPYNYFNSYFEDLDIGSRIEYANSAYSKLLALKEVEIEECEADLMGLYKQSISSKFEQYNDEWDSINSWREKEIANIYREKELKISEAQRKVEEIKQTLYSKISSTINRHASIPREKLAEIMKIYNLPMGSSFVDVNKMSLQEVVDLIDLAHYVSDNTVKNKKVSDKLLSLFYFPLFDKSRDEESEFIVKISHATVLIILMYLLKPYFMAIVGFIYIVHFLSNLYKVKEREELLCAAYEVSEPIDFMSFIEADAEYLEALKEFEDLSNNDEDIKAQVVEIEEEYERRLVELENNDPQKEVEEAQHDYNIKMLEYLQEFEKVTNILKDEKEGLVRLWEEHVQKIDNHFKELKRGMKLLGTEINNSRFLDLRFKIGSATYKEEVVAEATVELPMKNINFLYNSKESRRQLINFCKLLLCNALCNVKEKYIKVTIYDPNDLGKDFGEFLDVRLAEYIIVVNSDFRKLIEELITSTKNNIASFKGMTVQEYNKEADATGKVTKDYHIIIIASSDTELTRDKQISAFMKYSADYGIWIWNIMEERMSFKDNQEEQRDYMDFISNLPICREPGVITTDSCVIGGFTEPLHLYEYDQSIGVRTVENLISTIELNRVDALPYFDYLARTIPEDKIWTYSTLKGIELRLGYQDGDPDKVYAHVFGDNTVHALMAGQTGGGKSVVINEVLATMLHMYPPEELELIMVDFKNVEFKMYTEDLLIPHARIIAGTEDGEYALSIFDYVLDEMKRRTRLFGDVKVQKVEEYNTLMLARGEKEKYLPRILMIIDEFQVMFNKVPPKILDKIEERIHSVSKLARFAGLHMYFTSQSMKGTLSADILEQFKLRMALFLSRATSEELLGNPAASTLKSKGWIYSNDSGGQNANANRLFRVPLIGNKEIKQYLPKLIERCKREGRIHRHAEFYDEKRLHPSSDIINTYNKNPQLRKTKGLFILGERTMFSTNPLPYNVVITKDDGEHVIVSCFERESLLNIAQTFIENCIQREVEYCVHSADKESTVLMGLRDRVPESYRALLEEPFTASDLLDILEENVNDRVQLGVEKDHKEFYFIGVNWEKLDGIGRAESYNLQERLKSILQKAGQVNIHLILLMRDTSTMRQYLPCFNHKMISQCSERESTVFVDSDMGTKMDKVFGAHAYGTDINKFKIYQFEVKGELLKREINITDLEEG